MIGMVTSSNLKGAEGYKNQGEGQAGAEGQGNGERVMGQDGKQGEGECAGEQGKAHGAQAA